VNVSLHPLRGEMVVLTHTGECAFIAAGECRGAISSLISILSLLQLRFELPGLTGLCVFAPVFGLELVPDLVLGEVRVEVRDLHVARLPRILIILLLSPIIIII
ncbi:MAG: hypothetical protein ACI8RD_008910, partial [Bacillariaceae sp.]|jgi:hypothetical protein